MNIENYIESQYRLLNSDINYEYIDLYKGVGHGKLREIFSTLHMKLITGFKTMNDRLPTKDYENHFWADPSRDLISTIEIVEGLMRGLANTKLAFELDEYYQSIVDKCNTFLSRSGGSTIPRDMDKIDLYYILPIFISKSTITITNPTESKTFDLRLIGEGSYAHVFKYKDDYYDKYFVLKRAKKDLSQKELARFKREFEEMKNLNSPYIVDVYSYNDKANEYIMEFMDLSLHDYIAKYNTKLDYMRRKNIAFQILKAFSYIHSRKLLHRDISPKNVLVKLYDDVLVVKISDFGLVRKPNSTITSLNTEFKGYFNDPNLLLEGFDNYDTVHETFALTRLLYFVMEGKTNTDKISSPQLKEFVTKGLMPDKANRFQNVDELISAFKNI